MIKALQRALSCGVCIPLLAFAAPLWADAGDIATLLDQTQPKKALTASDAWLKDHPDDAQVRFLRGRALAAVGRTDDAIEVFAAMASADPQLPGPANNLAVLYAHQGKYEEARRWLEAAMQTSPAYAIAHRNLGDVYTALAALAYSKALEPDGQPRALGVQLEMVARLHQSRPAAAQVAATATDEVASEARVIPAPAPPPEPAKPPDTARPQQAAPEATAAVLAALDAWAKAWSAQNVDAYLDAYAANFDPEDDLPLDTWRETRRERLAAPAYIRLDVEDPVVTLLDDNTAKVVFVQSYDSDTYQDRVRKTIVMTRTAQGWRIVSETGTPL